MKRILPILIYILFLSSCEKIEEYPISELYGNWKTIKYIDLFDENNLLFHSSQAKYYLELDPQGNGRFSEGNPPLTFYWILEDSPRRLIFTQQSSEFVPFGLNLYDTSIWEVNSISKNYMEFTTENDFYFDSIKYDRKIRWEWNRY